MLRIREFGQRDHSGCSILSVLRLILTPINVMAGEGELEEGLEAFVMFAESAIEHIRTNYVICDVDTLNNVIEKVFQLCILLDHMIVEAVMETF